MHNPIRVAILTVCTLLLAACGDKPESQPEETGSAAVEMIERKAPEPRPEPQSEFKQPTTSSQALIKTEGRLAEEGSGLDVIINASDAEAFAESLNWIAQDASKEQFDNLERAIRVIRTYHPQVMGDEQRFLDLVDGKTGTELIAESVQVMKSRTGG